MRQISLTLRLILALTVMVVSVHTAIGRADARAALSVELCREGGIAIVTLDANGIPVTQQHDCPDCVLSGLACLGSLTVSQPPARSASRLRPSGQHTVLRLASLAEASARGPPMPVSA